MGEFSLDIRHESGDHLQIHIRSVTCDVTFGSVITSAWPGPTLDKQQFRYSLRLRYNILLEDSSNHCTCGDRLTVNHTLSYKKGNFFAQIHEGISNVLASLLSKVCKNVEVEPHLLPIKNKVSDQRSTVTSPGARHDIKTGGFWTRGVAAFSDIYVTYVNSTCNKNKL